MSLSYHHLDRILSEAKDKQQTDRETKEKQTEQTKSDTDQKLTDTQIVKTKTDKQTDKHTEQTDSLITTATRLCEQLRISIHTLQVYCAGVSELSVQTFSGQMVGGYALSLSDFMACLCFCYENETQSEKNLSVKAMDSKEKDKEKEKDTKDKDTKDKEKDKTKEKDKDKPTDKEKTTDTEEKDTQLATTTITATTDTEPSEQQPEQIQHISLCINSHVLTPSHSATASVSDMTSENVSTLCCGELTRFVYVLCTCVNVLCAYRVFVGV